MDRAQLERIMRWKPIVDQAIIPFETKMEALDILAIIYLESKGDPQARNAQFPAIGLMGVVAREGGKDFNDRPTIDELYDPRTNITWGIRILAWFLKVERASFWAALYRYSGGKTWPDTMDFVQKYWVPFGIIRADLMKAILEQE